MKKLKNCLLVMLCPLFNMQAQAVRLIKSGDLVPEVYFTNLINYKTDKAALSDFKGKLVILDFWATWCGSCVKEFPKMDSLQRVFGDQIAIIAVSYETPEKVAIFFKKHPGLKPANLLMVSGDSVLPQLFPHKSIPHEIWLQNGSVFYAETAARYVTATNIKACLDGEPYTGLQKKDLLAFDYDQPLLSQGITAIAEQLLMQSCLVKAITDLPGRDQLSEAGGLTRHAFINLPLVNIYSSLDPLPYFTRRVMVEGLPEADYLMPAVDFEDWVNAHAYSYEIIVPSQTHETDWKALALADINQNLHLDTRIERRAIRCNVLTRIPDPVPILQRPKPERPMDINDLLRQFNNQPFGDHYLPLFVDETGDSTARYQLPPDALTDPAALLEFLHQQGLQVTLTERMMDVFLIRPDKAYKQGE